MRRPPPIYLKRSASRGLAPRLRVVEHEPPSAVAHLRAGLPSEALGRPVQAIPVIPLAFVLDTEGDARSCPARGTTPP